MNKAQIQNLRRRTAELAVGPSTVRNAGARGVVRAASEALTSVNLKRFNVNSRQTFLRILNRETKKVRSQLPKGAQHWGVARKVLNIFLRDVVYHRHLCEHYSLRRIEKWLELPLDAQVAAGITAAAPEPSLPRWHSIKGLTPDDSQKYQDASIQIAKGKGVLPIHMEYEWWRVKN
jgi:hypothetical protein